MPCFIVSSGRFSVAGLPNASFGWSPVCGTFGQLTKIDSHAVLEDAVLGPDSIFSLDLTFNMFSFHNLSHLSRWRGKLIAKFVLIFIIPVFFLCFLVGFLFFCCFKHRTMRGEALWQTSITHSHSHSFAYTHPRIRIPHSCQKKILWLRFFVSILQSQSRSTSGFISFLPIFLILLSTNRKCKSRLTPTHSTPIFKKNYTIFRLLSSWPFSSTRKWFKIVSISKRPFDHRGRIKPKSKLSIDTTINVQLVFSFLSSTRPFFFFFYERPRSIALESRWIFHHQVFHTYVSYSNNIFCCYPEKSNGSKSRSFSNFDFRFFNSFFLFFFLFTLIMKLYLPRGSVPPEVAEGVLEPVVNFVESQLLVRRFDDWLKLIFH